MLEVTLSKVLSRGYTIKSAVYTHPLVFSFLSSE